MQHLIDHLVVLCFGFPPHFVFNSCFFQIQRLLNYRHFKFNYDTKYNRNIDCILFLLWSRKVNKHCPQPNWVDKKPLIWIIGYTTKKNWKIQNGGDWGADGLKRNEKTQGNISDGDDNINVLQMQENTLLEYLNRLLMLWAIIFVTPYPSYPHCPAVIITLITHNLPLSDLVSW